MRRSVRTGSVSNHGRRSRATPGRPNISLQNWLSKRRRRTSFLMRCRSAAGWALSWRRKLATGTQKNVRTTQQIHRQTNEISMLQPSTLLRGFQLVLERRGLLLMPQSWRHRMHKISLSDVYGAVCACGWDASGPSASSLTRVVSTDGGNDALLRSTTVHRDH